MYACVYVCMRSPFLFPKKGYIGITKNYISITLTSLAAKLYNTLLLNRIIEGVRGKNLKATLLFVDFSKVSDSIYGGKMGQILREYGLSKETVTAIMMHHRNTKVKVRSPDRDTEHFEIVAGIQQGDTLAPYLFIISRDFVLRTSIDLIKENDFIL